MSVSARMPPVGTIIQGCWKMKRDAVWIMPPHVGSGGCGPSPMKARPACIMMPTPKKSTNCTITVVDMFGRTCRKLAAAGLAGEFMYHGALDRDAKLKFLQSIDVLSVPATYDEPKGVFVLEAMAEGVPVVQPRRGAFTEMVEKTGGGLLVAADEPAALAGGIKQLFDDPVLADRLAAQGFDGVRQHYSIARSTDRLLAVYDSMTVASTMRPSDHQDRAAGF